MGTQVIDLAEQTFILINGPLLFFSLTVNIFYAYCLIFCNTQRLKQPLKMLLGFLVSCSILFCVSLVFMFWVLKEEKRVEIFFVAWVTVSCYLHNSMTCSVLLNFYYYIQIVPEQRALLIWIKRNIKSVMYMALLLSAILFLFNNTIIVAHSMCYTITYINGTLTKDRIKELYFVRTFFFTILQVHILICLCTMMTSSFSTAYYLHRHIRRVARGTSYFTTPKTQSQMRVTVTGILQGALYFLYAAFSFFQSLSNTFSKYFILGGLISFTVSMLYITCTTVNLGIGQALFRQRAAYVWKALKALSLW